MISMGLNLCGSTMLVEFADKVTENFTGKERDDETELNYFGARYRGQYRG